MMLGEYIRHLRNRLNYTQKDLSVLSGVKLSRIVRYEQGKLKSLSLDEAAKIYLALGGSRTITSNRPKSFKELYFDVIESEKISLARLKELSGLDERIIRDTLCQTSNIKIYYEHKIAGTLGFFLTEETDKWECKLIGFMDSESKVEYRESLEARYKNLAKFSEI